MGGRNKQGKNERRGDKRAQPSVTKVPSPALDHPFFLSH